MLQPFVSSLYIDMGSHRVQLDDCASSFAVEILEENDLLPTNCLLSIYGLVMEFFMAVNFQKKTQKFFTYEVFTLHLHSLILLFFFLDTCPPPSPAV